MKSTTVKTKALLIIVSLLLSSMNAQASQVTTKRKGRNDLIYSALVGFAATVLYCGMLKLIQEKNSSNAKQTPISPIIAMPVESTELHAVEAISAEPKLVSKKRPKKPTKQIQPTSFTTTELTALFLQIQEIEENQTTHNITCPQARVSDPRISHPELRPQYWAWKQSQLPKPDADSSNRYKQCLLL